MPDPDGSKLLTTMTLLKDMLDARRTEPEIIEGLLRHCVVTLDFTAAAVLLRGRSAMTVLVGGTVRQEKVELLPVIQGPWLEALRLGSIVSIESDEDFDSSDPAFLAWAQARQISGAYALPLRRAAELMGSLALFSGAPELLDTDQLDVLQALADATTEALLNRQFAEEQRQRCERLQAMVDADLIVEQARGVISERAHIGMGAALDLLKAAAKSSRRPLDVVAADVVGGRLHGRGFVEWQPDELDDVHRRTTLDLTVEHASLRLLH